MFESFLKSLKAHFDAMCAYNLFVVMLPVKIVNGKEVSSGNQLIEIYLDNFREGDDPIFRDPESSEHNCNNDKNFIRQYGNIVALIDGKVVTMWDVKLPEDSIYYAPCKAMSSALKQQGIAAPFLMTYDDLDMEFNYERVKKNQEVFQLGNSKSEKIYTKEEADKFGVVVANKKYTFHHFHVKLARKFVDFSGKSKASVVGDLTTTRQLFEKGLKIPLETLELVRDLFIQGSLLKPELYLNKVLQFIELKKQFEEIPANARNAWMWNNYLAIPFARFANELIGTTCIDLAEGKDLNTVAKEFNYRVDPANYMKVTSVVTPAMKALAEKQLEELGYGHTAFERRFATIADININEIRHRNVDNAAPKPVGLFAKAGVPTTTFNRHKRAEFQGVETVAIEKFLEEILPYSTSLEVFLENRMEGNLVAMFTAADKTAKNLFKWSNDFNWTYSNGLSGKSMIKENVQKAGGKVTGVFRCSLQWNDAETPGKVDFDLHCRTPFHEIYYGSKQCRTTRGELDVDMIRPTGVGIENITWPVQLQDGKYAFSVKNYDGGSNTGFKVEIEFNGDVFNYHFLTSSLGVKQVATVTVKNGQYTIEHHLPETTSSRKLWNLDSGQFHKVNLVCTSPNYWGDNAAGAKEYFFMLQDCKTDVALRAFHPDQLNGELVDMRKALDVLGSYMLVQPAEKQLAGLGFGSSIKDELIVKVSGTHNRTIKVVF